MICSLNSSLALRATKIMLQAIKEWVLSVTGISGGLYGSDAHLVTEQLLPLDSYCKNLDGAVHLNFL